MREHVYTYESPEYVQWFLDQLEPMQPFVVIFQKQDGWGVETIQRQSSAVYRE